MSDAIPVLDLKPLEHNPFLDGSVYSAKTGGVLVPRSTASMVDPVGNPWLEPRPSRASTEALRDSARSATRAGVGLDDVSLRGYTNAFGGLDTERLSNGLDQLSDAQLDDFVRDLTHDLAQTRAAAMAPRIAAHQALRRGAQFAGALGTAIDVYNVAEAIIDPTNNPLDELGDVAGSMVGGALGASLGPVGVLAGSLVGGYLGRALGTLLQGNGARAMVTTPGPERFRGGQEPGVRYVVKAEAVIRVVSDGRVSFDGRYPKYGIGIGPLKIVDASHEHQVGEQMLGQHDSRVGFVYAITGLPSNPEGTDARLDNIDIQREDGQPDTSGSFRGPAVTAPTRPTYAPVDTLDSPGGGYFPRWLRDPLQFPQGDPSAQPLNQPVGDGGGDGPAPDKYDDPPVPDNLPGPGPDEEMPVPVDPNPLLPCCDLNALNLEQLRQEIAALRAHFQATGMGSLNLADCGETAPESLAWQGSGLGGIYDALETLSVATNRLWDRVKCPPETTAAVPMAWEIKVHEHPQLIVLWGPVAGGSSRWAMHIPHPRSDIGSDYGFKFPTYTKGAVRGTLILADNSRVVVNGQSEAECQKVLSYVRGVIIPSYLDGAQEIMTRGTANFVAREVKAVYVKAFAGHRDQVPLWATQIK